MAAKTATRYDELTAEDIATLREAGASSEFIRMARHDDGKRNSIRENANSVLEGFVDTSGELSDVAFGHFGKYLWQGNLSKAFERADGRNTPLMVELFGLETINGDALTRGHRGFKEEDGRYVFK